MNRQRRRFGERSVDSKFYSQRHRLASIEGWLWLE